MYELIIGPAIHPTWIIPITVLYYNLSFAVKKHAKERDSFLKLLEK
jgi:hypothetical protein